MGLSLDTIKKLNPVKSINGIDNIGNALKGGLTHLSSIEFSKKYLWRVRFWPYLSHIVPVDFVNDFPLVDFDLDEANLETYSREFFMSNYKIPLKSKEQMLKLTFYDNLDNALFEWFKDWINIDILNNGNFISCIDDSHARKGVWSNGTPAIGNVEPVRKIIVDKLYEDLTVQSTQIFTIFPEGDLVFNGSSESGANVYSINFVIIDDGKKTVGGISQNIINTVGSNILDIGLSGSGIGNFL